MPRLKKKLAEQRWQYLLPALLVLRVGIVSRSRGARHDKPGDFTDQRTNGDFPEHSTNGDFADRPTNGFPVSPTNRAHTWADRAARVARAVEETTRAKRLRALNPARSDERNPTAAGPGGGMSSPTSGPGADLGIADRTRAGLLALAVAVSAGIHIGLTPEHLKEMPRLGDAFIVAAVLGSAIAAALVSRPGDRRIAALAGLFCLGQIFVWILFVTIRVPFFPGTPEPVETIALVSKAVEAVGWVLALGLIGSSESFPRKRPSETMTGPSETMTAVR